MMPFELEKATELERPMQKIQKANERARTVMVDVGGCSEREVAGHVGIILMSGVLKRNPSITNAIGIVHPS